MARSATGLNRSSKVFAKTKIVPSDPRPKKKKKKVMFTLWWSVAYLIHENFLNPGKSITSEKWAQQISKVN